MDKLMKTFTEALEEAMKEAKDKKDAKQAEDLIRKYLNSKNISTSPGSDNVVGRVKANSSKNKIEFVYFRGFITVYVNGDEKYEKHAKTVDGGVKDLIKWIESSKLFGA